MFYTITFSGFRSHPKPNFTVMIVCVILNLRFVNRSIDFDDLRRAMRVIGFKINQDDLNEVSGEVSGLDRSIDRC